MNYPISFSPPQIKAKRQFEEFVFIGDCTNESIADLTKQLNLSPNNRLVSQAEVEDCLTIQQIQTNKNIAHQLEGLSIKPGTRVELGSKSRNGSVIVSLGNKLIGIGAEIASQIVATSAV
ncbi:MAG: FeoA family protein [Cyanobacteria bacterium P01_G01_bin.19]